MNLEQAYRALETCMFAKVPALLRGPVGVGKTSICKQLARNYNMGFYYINAPIFDPLTQNGIPQAADGYTRFVPPDFLKQVREKPTIILIDELAKATPAVMNGFSAMLLEHRVGDHLLPEDCYVLATTNKIENKAGDALLRSHIVNRVVQINVDSSLNVAVKWMLDNNIRIEVIAFVRYRADLLNNADWYKSDANKSYQDLPFPTERAWEFVSRILDAGLQEDTEFEVLAGVIGEGAAAEFVGFLRIFRNLVDPDAVLLNPSTSKVPTEPSELYAITAALARMATEGNFDKVLCYAERMPTEFSVCLVKMAVQINPALQNTREFINYAVKNQTVFT